MVETAAGGRVSVAGVRPGGASAASPPLLLPAEHFAAGLVLLLAGAACLVLVAPELARGNFLARRVTATAHLFTLGWITTSIMGALYQFLPVALGEPIRSVRAGHAAFLMHVPGVAAFAAGLWLGARGLMLTGAVLLTFGIVLFAINLAATLWRAPRRDVTWWALAGANVFLLVTLLLGVALAGNLGWGYLGGARLTALSVHLHVALAGWVLLVIIGVAQRLLPMFLLSHGVTELLAWAAVALTAAGAGTMLLSHHGPRLLSHWLPAVLLAAGLVCFLAQALQFYRRRHRPRLDPGMSLAAGALVLFAAVLLLSVPVLAGGAAPNLLTAYVLTAVLAITLFVAAHYYKIVPFLVWYHRFGPLAGRQTVPRVDQLYHAGTARTAAALLFAGAAGLAAAVAGAQGGLAQLAALLLAAGVTLEAIQMAGLVRRRS
jgi:hypothetical protein